MLTVHEPKKKVDGTPTLNNAPFNFDHVFGESSHTSAVYDAAVAPLVRCAASGGAATVFAYGQTGSGKTYTMGPISRRAIADLLTAAEQQAGSGLALSMSYFEIYLSDAFDLLSEPRRAPVKLLEDAGGAVQVCARCVLCA